MAIIAKKWDSGLKVVVPEVYLSVGLTDIFAAVQKKVGDKEFSILLKGGWDERYNGYYIGSDYYIPLQQVGACSVDYHQTYSTEKQRDMAYDELIEAGLKISKTKIDDKDYAIQENLHQLKKDGYIVIAHSHPFLKGKSGGFSGADDDHINKHFPCSLLLNGKGEVVKANLLIPTEIKHLKVRVLTEEITQLVPAEDAIEVEGIEKIKTVTTVLIQDKFDWKKEYYQTHKCHNEDPKIITPATTDAYLGDGIWQSDVDKDVAELVADGFDEAEVRGWYDSYPGAKT